MTVYAGIVSNRWGDVKEEKSAANTASHPRLIIKRKEVKSTRQRPGDTFALSAVPNVERISDTMATATQKSAVIEIAGADFEFLKPNQYQLCFAKMVNGVFDVVWQSYNDYLMTNTFQWTPEYQLFGTNTFQDAVTVIVQTNVVNIDLGEQSIMDSAGMLGNASSGGPSTAITLINQYGPIHPGMNQLSTGVDGTQVSTPIYVATNAIALGTDQLTPVDQVSVWFEQDIATSTMFSTARANAVTIDLTNDDSATWLYQGGKWSLVSSQILHGAAAWAHGK
jgi:hypothetical protein